MKQLVIEKERARLLFDPKSPHIRIDAAGGFLGVPLDYSDLLKLETAIGFARRAMRVHRALG